MLMQLEFTERGMLTVLERQQQIRLHAQLRLNFEEKKQQEMKRLFIEENQQRKEKMRQKLEEKLKQQKMEDEKMQFLETHESLIRSQRIVQTQSRF